MQPCNKIYYSNAHWRLNMFRAAYRSSSGALTLFVASGLHTYMMTGGSQVWVGTGQFPLRLDYGRSPHAYVNQRLQIYLELLMMSGMPLETFWAFNERLNNKFYYKVASCWLFLLIQNVCLKTCNNYWFIMLLFVCTFSIFLGIHNTHKVSEIKSASVFIWKGEKEKSKQMGTSKISRVNLLIHRHFRAFVYPRIRDNLPC
jgi:hypothetical protein